MKLNNPITKTSIFLYSKYNLLKSKSLCALIMVVKILYNIISLEDEEAIAKYYSLIKDTIEENRILLVSIIRTLLLKLLFYA